MHGIFGEREGANCGRVSTPTCALAWFHLLVSPVKLLPPADFQLFISVLTPVRGSRPTGPILELF